MQEICITQTTILQSTGTSESEIGGLHDRRAGNQTSETVQVFGQNYGGGGQCDNHAAFCQLKRAREKWGRIAGILSDEGANPKTMGYFYKPIAQAILLYGSESWTLTRKILRRFNSFHARVARYLTG